MNEIDENDFDFYWLGICEYANSIGVSPSYIEDEFLIYGELIKVPLREADPRQCNGLQQTPRSDPVWCYTIFIHKGDPFDH